MIIGNLLVLKDYRDLNDLGKIIWNHPYSTRYEEGIVNHKGNNSYPQYYKYCSGDIAGCCGEYYPISKSEFNCKLQIIIENYQETIKVLQTFLSEE